MTTLQFDLYDVAEAVAYRLALWEETELGRRIWDRDHTVWFPEPQPELTDRLGWLDLPTTLGDDLAMLDDFRKNVLDAGFSHVVVLGMGGSSLAPEVFQAVFGAAPGHPELLVLDSTHPDAVRDLEARIDLRNTLFIVSSKSGTTIETLSFFRYFWNRLSEQLPDPGSRFVAITDPGTPLEELAGDRGFRRVFTAPPDVGGRYSALSPFGMVPAAAIGAGVEHVQREAAAAAAGSGRDVVATSSPALHLGAALGELALAGRDKVTFITTQSIASFPAWIEQLVAESTGKHGTGIVPVTGELPGDPSVYGNDRVIVTIVIDGEEGADSVAEHADRAGAAGHPVIRMTLPSPMTIGGAMFEWELAVAAAGSILEINPFDQPDVQLAKDLANQAMSGSLGEAATEEVEADDPALAARISEWLGAAGPGDYIGIHAYLPPRDEVRLELQAARTAIRNHFRVATTLDFGPRFLHSTGQLHKGGPASGRFLQIIDHPGTLPVPETEHGFGELITAQAGGDASALRDRGRSVMTVCLGDGGIETLRSVRDALIAATDDG